MEIILFEEVPPQLVEFFFKEIYHSEKTQKDILPEIELKMVKKIGIVFYLYKTRYSEK